MNKIKFWQSWDTHTKYPYLFILGLSIAALLLGAYHYITGNDLAFAWDKISDLQVVPLPVHESTHLLETFTLTADGYLLLEQYDIAQPVFRTTPSAFMLGFLVVCLAFYIATISAMKRTAYFGGMALLMLLLATFNMDALGVYGSETGQTMLVISIIVLAIASYGFQAFWVTTSLLWRVAAILGVEILLGLLIYTESEFPASLITLHLVNYSSIGFLVATVLFILWVAYENVNALLWINTQAKTAERRFSIWQFLLISFLYLLNLALLYLRHMGYVEFDIFYINGYVLLLLSAISGFWGMRQREAYYGGLFRFKPVGAVLYLVFATVAFLSIGYAYATANDSLTVMYHDVIVYTHLAFGFAFLLYVLVNFSRLLEERLQVYKVVYQPKSFSLFAFLIVGTVLTAILVMRTQYRVYFYAKAGYYNYLGDLYRASDNHMLAARFYEESDIYDPDNVKANYSLADMHRAAQESNNEIIRLKNAVVKRPNPKLYIRLANLYDGKEFFFEKMYVLREGLAKFPESGELYNNMALLYAQTSITDSTDYYFDLAQQYSSNEDFVKSNRLAFYTKQAMLEPARELLQDSKGDYTTLRSNAALLRQLIGVQPDAKDAFVPDSLQQVEDFTLFYNQTIGTLNTADTTRLAAINAYIAEPDNQLFQESLIYLKGLVQHYNGQPKEARAVVENLALAASARSGYYYDALGIWMMEENNYRAAAAYFKQAKDRGNPQSYISEGYAHAMAHQPAKAVQALEEVGFTGNKPVIEVAQKLATVLRQNVSAILATGADEDKVTFLLTYLPRLSFEEVNKLVDAVEDKDLKRRALVARIDYLINLRRWKTANDLLKEAGPQLQPEGELRSKLNVQQMKVWLETKNYDVLLSRMNNLHLTERDKRLTLYYRARVADLKGRTQEAATRYEQALKMLLYKEEVVLAAADFFSRYKPKEENAYNILLAGITYNAQSAELQKAYALESINQGLYSYADDALAVLKDLLPAAEYSTFSDKLLKQRQQSEARADDWQL